MTLILNEIHVIDGLERSFQISAADRRITCNGKFNSNKQKIFEIPYLNSTISYFGLASMIKNGKLIYFSNWLPDFIRRQAKSSTDIGSFAHELRNTLNKEIPEKILCNNHSGFHISGYTNGLPDFWFLTNISGMNNFYYKDPLPKYAEPTSHFLGRDAKANFKWDGVDPKSAISITQIYRNGDFRSHVIASEKIDSFMDEMFTFPDFNRPRSVDDYAKYVKFKFEILSFIYKKFAKNEIIGRPIDVYINEIGNLRKI